MTNGGRSCDRPPPGWIRLRAQSCAPALLDLGDVLRRGALGPLDDVELNPLTFREAAEAISLDGSVVDEAVLGAVLGRDEPITLGVVEPLHRAGDARHAAVLRSEGDIVGDRNARYHRQGKRARDFPGPYSDCRKRPERGARVSQASCREDLLDCTRPSHLANSSRHQYLRFREFVKGGPRGATTAWPPGPIPRSGAATPWWWPG